MELRTARHFEIHPAAYRRRRPRDDRAITPPHRRGPATREALHRTAENAELMIQH